VLVYLQDMGSGRPGDGSQLWSESAYGADVGHV